MDYNDKYRELFKALKTHKYDQFIKIINEIDDNDFIFDVNVRDEQNNYFLTYAVMLNKIDICQVLIKKGARIDITNKNDESILVLTIEYSYFDILELLLRTNKESIGVSIIDIKDKNMKIPLHYAIEIQNIKAIELLLKYGSNPNTTEKNGYNSLHLAVKTHSLQICEIIVKYIADINSRYNTGESSLHMSCNLQLVEICKLLLKNGALVNIQDYSHEITPLHYSVLVNNKEIIAMLLKHGANPNSQDIYGNTPLHYGIIEDNFEVFLMITKSTMTQNIINLSAWNIYGETPLHLVLKNDTTNLESYLNIILEKSNLTLQDNEGNTCLHYLIQLKLWKQYKKIIKKKRLDIFTLNDKKISPIDMIKKEEYDEFIEIIIESYINRLKTAGELWFDEWENICAKKYEEITNEEKKIIGTNIITTNNTSANTLINTPVEFDLSCVSIIRQKLLNIIKKYKNGEKDNCYDQSFPVKRSTICLNITEGSKVSYCTFTGSTLDILIGLIYLLKKHSDTCSTLTKNFTKNKELCGFYKSIGIIMNSKCEFLNFEIIWINQRLYLMEGFYEQIKKCLNSKTKFIIIPIGIEMKEGNHAGYLIYDTKKNEVERFEPHGSTTPPGLFYNPNLLDDILESRFKAINDSIKYVRPHEYIPKIGFQLFDSSEVKKKKIGDPMGFCALWCIWYVDMRLTYRNIDRKKLVDILIRKIKSQNISFKNMVRNYGENIINIRDRILLSSKMDINDWQNDQYTDIQINSVLDKLIEEIETVTKN